MSDWSDQQQRSYVSITQQSSWMIMSITITSTTRSSTCFFTGFHCITYALTWFAHKDILTLCSSNRLLTHHYNDLLLDLYVKLGDSHIAYCYQSYTPSSEVFVDREDPTRILNHAYSALDCYHTVGVEGMVHCRQARWSPKRWTDSPRRWPNSGRFFHECSAAIVFWSQLRTKYTNTCIMSFFIQWAFHSLFDRRFNTSCSGTFSVTATPSYVVPRITPTSSRKTRSPACSSAAVFCLCTRMLPPGKSLHPRGGYKLNGGN